MSLSDLLNKAKQWAGKNPDKAEKGVDQGSSMLKKRFAGHEEQIDSASAKAKDYLRGSGSGNADPQPPAAPGEETPPPPPQR